MSKNRTRTFIAIEAVDEVHVRALSAIDQLSEASSNVKWLEADKLHWTLHFLGDISDEDIAHVCRLVGRVATRHEPFLLTARGVGAFPKPERPRTLWLGAGKGSEPLCRLQADLEKGLAKLGFRGENRRYVPHLTLGRVQRGREGGPELAEALAELAEFDGAAMEVAEVTVYASVLEREGAIYHVLSHSELGAPEQR
jgi:RNA 2',3'-cyclic 3'-phosphodiesterase